MMFTPLGINGSDAVVLLNEKVLGNLDTLLKEKKMLNDCM